MLHKKGWKTKDNSLTETILVKGKSTLWWCNIHHKPLQQIKREENGKDAVLKKYEL